VLYDELGLKPGKKTKTGYSTDAQTLESLRGEHPIIDALLSYREVEKLRSTYGENLLAEVAAGRPHPRLVPPDRGPDRAHLVGPAQPAQHPGAHRAGQAVPRAFVPARGALVPGGRLRPGRAAGDRPSLGDPG
jgi:DNA polymerase-1